MAVDPNLLQAARLLAKLSLDELARRAHVSRRSIQNMEAGESDCLLSTMELVREVLEAEGIIFLGETEFHGPGVRVSRATASGWTRKRTDSRRGRTKPEGPSA